MLTSKLYWGYLTSNTQMVQPPSLSQIGLSFNNNSAFAFVGSLSDIVDYCCKHRSVKLVLQRSSSIARDIDPRIDGIEVQVTRHRRLYTLMNPLASVMVTLRPHTLQGEDTRQSKRFVLPPSATLIDLAANLNQLFSRSTKQVVEAIRIPSDRQHRHLAAHANSISLLSNTRHLPDAEIDTELPLYTSVADGEAGGFSFHGVREVAPPEYVEIATC
ncbi:hypothetical protein NQZ79_g5342 [Umbelopsis isabellina]|nr:hypothetical protein NQZ79_g5342 [Umbelopsis isabellina]